MPEAITDTSPIQYLHQTNLLHLLPNLYGTITMPQAVATELEQGRLQSIDLPDLASLDWLTIVQLQPSSPILQIPGLGAGEREVLTLATLIPDALALLDDGLARSHARQLGAHFTGTLGILLKAKQLGLIKAVQPTLDQLNQLNFRLAQSTYRSALRLAGELNL